MKRKRFTEEEIIGILKESDWGHIHALKRHGDPQAVLQRIASIVREMRPNLMLDSGETITGTRIADVVAPTWLIVDGPTALRFGVRPGPALLKLGRVHP